MARITNEELAKTSPCHGFYYIEPKTGEKKFLLWSKGAIGILLDPQEAVYCPYISSLKPLSPGLERRFDILRGLEDLPCLPEDAQKEIVEILEEYKKTVPEYEIGDVDGYIKDLLDIPKCKD